MIAPLYKNAEYPAKHLGGHKGLWFERFFDRYDDKWKVADEQKQKWIDTVAGNCGDDAVLQSNAINQQQLCSDLGGQSQTYTNNWHFVTGMGNNHPVENGFTWHSTLGTPYLSGASVKGLIRSWMEQWAGLEVAELREKLYFWFGSEDKKAGVYEDQKEAQAGAFIFFDAVPIESVELGCDIMTPHMKDWYSKGGSIKTSDYANTLPADWHNPIPIPFLVVKDATFQFCITPRPRTKSTKEDIEEIMQVLAMALEYLGAGAKTATGYGRFEVDEKAGQDLQQQAIEEKQKAEQEARLANMSPLEQEMEMIISHDTNPSMTLFNKLQVGDWDTEDDQRIVAQKVQDLWKAEKKWNPEFSGKNKQKVKQKNRCVKLQEFL